MSKVTKSIIRTVIEQAINRYDNSRNKEEIIDVFIDNKKLPRGMCGRILLPIIKL